jgi:FlaA1/EpsC-like NDP-sugar epimerase
VDWDSLSNLATGRQKTLFSEDVESCHSQIEDTVKGKRVLVIGGAGSIGSSTVLQLASFGPSSLHVVDQNENNLAELVRDIRNQQEPFNVIDFQALPIDFGSPIMARLIKEQSPYNIVMNFAAIKHVRSEKDTYSVLQMLDTNVIKPVRLISWLDQRGGVGRYFCVSTDKAANPVNLMGASKRLMEHIIFSGEVSDISASITSARFANVAFSDGSLLFSWLRRLEKNQPLVVPLNTKRFFISTREAGQICLIAGTCAPDRTILIPRFQPEKDLKELRDIAISFLRMMGFEPHEYLSEEEAKSSIDSDRATGKYPLLLTPLDTSGEKSYEEFVGSGEYTKEVGFTNLLAIPYEDCSNSPLRKTISSIMRDLNNSNLHLDKEQIIKLIMSVIPEFHHIETKKYLDNRM